MADGTLELAGTISGEERERISTKRAPNSYERGAFFVYDGHAVNLW